MAGIALRAGRAEWEVDEAAGLDWLRDIERRGLWRRNGSVFAESVGHDSIGALVYDLWVQVPPRWVDTSTLLATYAGPGGGSGSPCCCWFPGTTAPGHCHNPRSRFYARLTRGLVGFDVAKREAAVLVLALDCAGRSSPYDTLR